MKWIYTCMWFNNILLSMFVSHIYGCVGETVLMVDLCSLISPISFTNLLYLVYYMAFCVIVISFISQTWDCSLVYTHGEPSLNPPPCKYMIPGRFSPGTTGWYSLTGIPSKYMFFAWNSRIIWYYIAHDNESSKWFWHIYYDNSVWPNEC